MKSLAALLFLGFALMGVFFFTMGFFDARAVRKQKQNYAESQYLQTTMARLALEDRIASVMTQQRHLMDHLLKEEPLPFNEIQLLLQSAIYNTSDVLGFSFVPWPNRESARPFAAFRSTPSGNDAREFARTMESRFDFASAEHRDPQMLSGKIIASTHTRMIALVEGATSGKDQKWYSIAILSLSPFLSRYILPLAQGVSSDFFMIDSSGIVMEHKQSSFIGKNVADLDDGEGRALYEVWLRLKESFSGMECLESTFSDLAEPSRRSLTWNSVRVGSNRFYIGSYVPEQDINPLLTELRAQRYMLSGGVLILFLFSVYVLSKIKRSSAARRAEESLKAVFNGLPTGIAVLDEAGAILACNEKLERMTGRTKEQLKMRTIYDLVAPSSQEQKEELREALAGDGNFASFELLLSGNEAEMDSPLNSSFWTSVKACRLDFEPGTKRWVVAFTDISEYKRTEHHLESSVEELKSREEDLSRRAKGQDAFLEMFSKFADCESVEDLFEIISEHMAPIIPFRGLTLYVRKSREATSYEVIDTMGDVVKLDQTDFMEKRKGVLGRVAETGRPYLMGDASIDPYFIPHSSEVRSAVFAPVLHKNFLWGAIVLDSETKHTFGVRERDLLTIVASYLALHLEEAAAREELGRKAKHLSFLHRFVQKIAAERSNEELARRIVDVLSDELGFPGAAFYTPPKKGESSPILLAGRFDDKHGAGSPGCHFEAGAAMRSRTFVERRENGKAFTLAIPVSFEGEVFGALAARHDKGFSESVHELLEITAEHMSTFWALNNLIALRRHESLVDPLTQVWNRRYIIHRLDEENSRISRTKGKGAVVLVDLGDFKRINDRYGHTTGDEVLRVTSATMSKKLRDYDMIGRYGGDEFLIYLPDVTRQEAEAVMLRMEDMVGEQRVEGYDGRVILDYGIAVCPGDGANLTDAIRIADERMYRNKERRKARARG
ncbi:MAG: diguanylate cyclase [Synergistota bacterium]|nr:diguanylate cyclase [Synergistota bacterium]